MKEHLPVMGGASLPPVSPVAPSGGQGGGGRLCTQPASPLGLHHSTKHTGSQRRAPHSCTCMMPGGPGLGGILQSQPFQGPSTDILLQETPKDPRVAEPRGDKHHHREFPHAAL